MGWVEEAKKRVAVEAVNMVKDGFLIGLGTGSTVSYAIEEIGRKVREEKLRILAVPTSNRTLNKAAELNIPLSSLDEHPILDLDIDGCDQIDNNLDMIKGMGGALLREKIVAESSRKTVIITDARKYVETLGNNQILPIEILPFALKLVSRRIGFMGEDCTLRIEGSKPFITDNGNYILNVTLGNMTKPEELDLQLRRIPGVIETGFFLDMADLAYIGTQEGLTKIIRHSTR